jgi:hypothetical protein
MDTSYKQIEPERAVGGKDECENVLMVDYMRHYGCFC